MPVPTVQSPLPDDVKQALQDGLPNFQSATARNRDDLSKATNGTGGTWLQVFTVGAPSFISGRGTKDAVPSGWRIAAGSGVNASAADIYTMERKGARPMTAGTARLACIRRGAEPDRLLNALASLSTNQFPGRFPDPLPSVEPTFLSLPGLFTDALWLKATGPGATSAILPFYSLVRGLSVDILYKEQDFIHALRPIAERWSRYTPRF